MGKISLVSAKYIIHASIEIKGSVDRPDVIGAIFGQTEGLLGSDLELRELQRGGRIGRIEVNVESKAGVTKGEIIIPSSLDKAETSIVGAALEIIQRIGPCDAKIIVNKIEDVRISKRKFLLTRAKGLLKDLSEKVLPDSQELAEEVAQSVRVLEIQEFGKDRLPAGPHVEEAEEIFLVEGRADVLNLLKHGIKNAVAMNGTSVLETIKELTKRKVAIAFVDGDRGGDLIIKELASVSEVDFVIKAPDGKEVEEISKKELLFALRSKKPIKEFMQGKRLGAVKRKTEKITKPIVRQTDKKVEKKEPVKEIKKNDELTKQRMKQLKELGEYVIGARAAICLDDQFQVLGKVPVSELVSTIKNLDKVTAIVFDGDADDNIVEKAEKKNISYLICMNDKTSKTKKSTIKVSTLEQLD